MTDCDRDYALALQMQEEESGGAVQADPDAALARRLQAEEDAKAADKKRAEEEDFKMAARMAGEMSDDRSTYLQKLGGSKVTTANPYSLVAGAGPRTAEDVEDWDEEDEEEQEHPHFSEDPTRFKYDEHGNPRLLGRLDKNNPQPPSSTGGFKKKKTKLANEGSVGKARRQPYRAGQGEGERDEQEGLEEEEMDGN
eukprot:TRINITY_DN103091_c0_g1_i1.p1 TRINITY_DN103091_c0_g1~~TRINITY_DN103091_c0_g1_i1.p1  ORF type:complete len:219 (-),score=69.28 TRINITY_DN103091_c0_g1_i1:291-878(-)